MSTSYLELQLEKLEKQCRQTQSGLLDGDVNVLQHAGKALLELTVELNQLATGPARVQLNQAVLLSRVKALAAAITALREGVLRRLALVERGLEIVVPATRNKATYGAGGAYGSPARQSGSLSFLSA